MDDHLESPTLIIVTPQDGATEDRSFDRSGPKRSYSDLVGGYYAARIAFLERVAEAAKGQTFVGEAPVVIATCATVTDYVMTCGQITYPIALAIAADHMTLKAVEVGRGAQTGGVLSHQEEGEGSPFTGKYYGFKLKGIYRCVACGNDIFLSETKFDSGSGWPSFWAPVSE